MANETSAFINQDYVDSRTFLQKSSARVVSLAREVSYSIGNLKGRVVDAYRPQYDSCQIKQWQKESKGLYVLIHGLNGHPNIWQTHVAQLKSEVEYDLFVPYVPLKGNGPIEKVAALILTIIENYAENHPKKPICLIGVSNGGRMCTWLETHLRHSAPNTPVKVSTIAAVHFGSSRMNLVAYLYQKTGWSLGYDLSIVKELSLGSDKAKEILQEVQKPLPDGVIRSYECYASTEDLQVPEIGSSLPKFGDQLPVTYHVVHGYDHNGIVKGVAIAQIQNCIDWMGQF